MTKGEQTRRRIVAAAAPIFNQQGYEGSSLSELMAATGLKKGGIYRHFESKEELAAEAFDYTWETAWLTRTAHLDLNGPSIDTLKQLIANFVDCRPPIAGGCPILNTAVDTDDGNPVLRGRVSKALRSWMTFVQTIVKQGMERREIKSTADPKAIATLIIVTLEGALMMSRLDRNDDALRCVQRHLNHYLETEVAA